MDSWNVAFRRETDRNRRREILDQAEKDSLLSPEEAAFRRKILDARYDRKKDQLLDYYIRGWTKLNLLQKPSAGPGSKRRDAKDVRQVFADWQVDFCGRHGEMGRAALFDELYNMARLYIQLCEEDRRYNSVVLGFGRMKQETRTEKIASEFRAIMYDVPRRLNMEDDFSMFREAAKAAFGDCYPEQKELIEPGD